MPLLKYVNAQNRKLFPSFRELFNKNIYFYLRFQGIS